MRRLFTKIRTLIKIVALIAFGFLSAVLVTRYVLSEKQPGTILSNYAKNNQKRVMIKWDNYFEIFERHLSRFRNTDVNVLEIGVGVSP